MKHLKGYHSVFCYSVILIISNLLITSGQEPTCHTLLGEEALNFLATKRPYHYNNSENSDFIPDSCTPIKFWYFGRHGTRYPGEDDILAMQTILPELFEEILYFSNSSEFCQETLNYFSTWTPRPDLNISTESFLHTRGEWELSSIASRYIERFSNLFPPTFSNDSYLFKFTKSQRTEASARSFVSSIFGSDKIDTVYFPKPSSKDPILRFYSACPKWEKEVSKNPEANKEHSLFVTSAVMNSTISRVSKRLGLNRNLTLEEITTAFTTCAFETAWDNETLSQWCSLFDKEDFTVMEYAEDLEYYYQDGYGFQINWEQACAPFVDLMQFLEHDEDSNTKVQAYFSHSRATLKMFARLGLFNGSDESKSMEIRHDNFEEMKDVYEWKTSQIDYFGTNMAFVMYSCNDAATPGTHQKQVGFFAQERPTEFPACNGNAFCPFEEFSSRMGEFTNNCVLDDICRV